MIFLKLDKKTLELKLEAEGYNGMECVKDLDKITKILEAQVLNRRLKTTREAYTYLRRDKK